MKSWYILGLLVGLGVASQAHLLAAGSEPELKLIQVQTDENQGINGDSIVVFYSEPMIVEASPYPLAGGMEDVNNVPGSELKAPAEYPHHQGNATAEKVAKNYAIEIIPGQHSTTQPYTGTWADLGGKAIYNNEDGNKKSVFLVLGDMNRDLWEPGDVIKLTVAETVIDPEGNPIKTDRRVAYQIAS